MKTTTSRRNTAPTTTRVVNQDITDALADFAQRVTARLNDVARFQSIGRKKYVYVEDVAQALDIELYGGRSAE